MNHTFLRRARSEAGQQVVEFTGEGAYHGSTRPRPAAAPAEPDDAAIVAEMRPLSLAKYAGREGREIDTFTAVFPNRCEVVEALPAPSQAELAAEDVTLCWCPFADALREAGPITREVLAAMQRHINRRKRHIYVDSKIQFFHRGDVPVDSRHWHVDGSIAVRDARVARLGHALLHDMRARLEGPAEPPTYLSYQSSTHCATRFVTAPVTVVLPELIADFDELDRQVRAIDPPTAAQPAGAIVRFDGLSLHRAVAASESGWRLWIRCIETDREVALTSSIIDCYGKVYRLAGPPQSG
ncbi:MAG: hypothetical protein JNL82_34400 [Myxococcales bacterium]|nr:hypothetical protein [Myxococcales bacterium]